MPTATITGIAAGSYNFLNAGVAGSVTVTAIEFSVDLEGNEPVVTYQTGGAISITIASGIYEETYTTDYNGVPLTTTLVEAGAVCLVEPTTTSNTAVGAVQTATPGLYIYVGDYPGDPSGIWQRGDVDISGEVFLTHTIASLDVGADLTYLETFDDIEIPSDAVNIPSATMAADTGALAWFNDTVTVDGSDNITNWPNQALNGASDWEVDTVPTGLVAPVWDAVNKKAAFTGGEMLISNATVGTPIYDKVVTDGGTLTVLVVADVANNGSNFGALFGFVHPSSGGSSYFAGPRGGQYVHYNMSDSYATAFTLNANVATPFTISGKQLWEVVLTRTNFKVYVGGNLVAEETFDNDGAIFERDPFSFAIGGAGRSNSTYRAVDAGIYEVFVTSSINNVPAFKTELNARHGL